MKNSFYGDPHPCCIYLLLLDMNDEEPYYYVGKSFSCSVSKVYSRHLHGGFASTKDIFSVDSRPNLYILQDRLLTGADAYRFIVAYHRFFEEQKLGESLNYDGTMWQAEFMKPETEKIYREISQESLPELLRRTYVARAVDADRNRDAKEHQENKWVVQLNVGITADDKALFDTYCKQLGLGHKEGFGALLDAACNKTDSHYESIISSKAKKIEKLEQEIKRLEQKLALATGEALPKREVWASEVFPLMLDGVKQYLQLLFPQRDVIQPVKSKSYKGFTRSRLPDEECIYPEKEGFHLIRLEAVLWGNHKSCFYAGTCLDGKHYKFRYYSKAWFLGVPPRGSGYEEQDSLWLLGCKRAADGAMDLIAAFPLPSARIIDSTPKSIQSEKMQKPTLAEKLASIEERRS